MPAKRPFVAEDLYDLHFVEDPQYSPDGRHIAFVKLSLDKLENQYRRHIWLAAARGPKPEARQFTFGAKSDTSPRWSPDGQALAFVSARGGKPQIYVISMAGGEARPLTAMPNGATRPAWSPDGRRIAFLSSTNAEERRREDRGQKDKPPATALEAKHRAEIKAETERQKTDPRVITRLPYRSGTEFFDDRQQHIYVADVQTDGPPAEPYRITDGDVSFNVIAWAADGKTIFSTQSRTPAADPWFNQDIIRLSATGKRKPFRWVTRPGYSYFQVRVSPDGRWLAATRQREDGSFGVTTHLVVMPARGRRARELTTALDREVEAFRWSADSRNLLFTAGDQGDTGIYRVGAAGSRPPAKVVGGRRMVLGFDLDRAGRLAYAASAPERPADLYAALASGRSEKRLTDFNADLLAARNVAETEEVRYAAPDGYPLQGWLIKPAGFRRGRRYPLAVHVHGGPHIMWGPGMPSMWLEWQLHAARGYAVFYCNPRGAAGYGEAHADAIRNNWGELAMHDILAGVDHVAQNAFVDQKRLALTGGSYAGYMTAWIVAHDQRFACAWAQRGLYNLLSWYGTSDVPQLIEREFEMFPYDEVDRLWRQSPLAYVRNIRTPLAIEHQDQDYRCPVSDAEQLFTALKRLKRTVVFYRYPREGHEMSRAGEPQHRVDRLKRMTAWFDKHCQKPRKK